jgi:hypothetical protein
MSGIRHHTTQSHPAYEPQSKTVGRGWMLLTAGLLLTALAALCLRPVCLLDLPGANESGFGVRHEQRGTVWYHCEPWIRRALGD